MLRSIVKIKNSSLGVSYHHPIPHTFKYLLPGNGRDIEKC